MPSSWSKVIVSDFNPRGTTNKPQQVQIAGFQAKKGLPSKISLHYCEKQNHPISSIVFKFRLAGDQLFKLKNNIRNRRNPLSSKSSVNGARKVRRVPVEK
jgi:hypothetical protein